MTRGAEAALRGSLWLLLGAWLGAWLLFAFGVAPVVFRELPSEAAGRIAGPVLDILHVGGAAAGIALALLARALGRGRAAVGLPLAMAALCLGSQFGVTAEIERTRELAFGAGGNAEGAARFWRLHGLSMGIFTVVGLLGMGLAALHGVAEGRDRARGETPT